jgi:hypothetical protein
MIPASGLKHRFIEVHAMLPVLRFDDLSDACHRHILYKLRQTWRHDQEFILLTSV